jgi:SSS family solute:Na+ symporter
MGVMTVVSLRTPAPPPEKVDGLTWTPAFFRAESRELEGVPFYKNYRWQSVGLVALTVVVVSLFW